MTFWNLPILVLFSNSASVWNFGTIQITALRMNTIFPVIFENSICPQVICDAFKLSCFVRQGNCFSTTSTKENLPVWQWSWIIFCFYYYFLFLLLFAFYFSLGNHCCWIHRTAEFCILSLCVISFPSNRRFVLWLGKTKVFSSRHLARPTKLKYLLYIQSFSFLRVYS